MNFFHTSQRGKALVTLSVLGGAALLAGCGGSGGSNSSNTAQIRAVNTISNGGSGTISVNGTSIAGNQGYFTSSSYQSLGSAASSVTFGLSTNSGASYVPVTANFSLGNYYSVILVGRADVTSTTDPRYPSVLVTSDTFTTLSSGQAGLRVIHAAPDAGKIDVLVNGTIIASGAAYKAIDAVVGEPSGNVTIQVNQSGTNTVLVTPQTVGLTGGHVYTVYVVEPTVSPTPLYGLQETDDTAAAFPNG